MQERDSVGIFIGAQRRFMHQTADGKVRHQQPIKFLAYQFGSLAAQYDLCAPKMRLEFVERGLSGKGLARC
jgi:hypothetical protein